MYQQFSSPADRRLSALARHLEGSSPSSTMDTNHTISASATSGSDFGGSVFAHVVQAPEDPILGVLSLTQAQNLLVSLFGCWESSDEKENEFLNVTLLRIVLVSELC